MNSKTTIFFTILVNLWFQVESAPAKASTGPDEEPQSFNPPGSKMIFDGPPTQSLDYSELNYNPCNRFTISWELFYHTHPHDKTKFIQCDESGRAFVKQCPLGTKWDQGLLTCNHPGDIVYAPGPPKYSRVSVKDSMHCSFIQDVMHGKTFYHEHPRDTSKFLLCNVDGNSYEMTCEPGLVWNQAKLECGGRPDVKTLNYSETFCSQKNLNYANILHPLPYHPGWFVVCDYEGSYFIGV